MNGPVEERTTMATTRQARTTADGDRRDFSELTMNTEIERIGQELLGLETLETRNSDSMDFSEQAVWTLRRALEAAYKAGQATRA
jgi:hypothetical protein